jgi:peptidoglycan hydrolase CwlO-like protein
MLSTGKMVHVIVEGVPAAADSQIIREQYEAEMGYLVFIEIQFIEFESRDLKTDKQRLEKKVQNLQSKIEQLQQQVPEKKQKDSGRVFY